MLYIYLALLSALGFSLSDICSKYLLDSGVSNLQYLLWGHGLLYIVITICAIFLASHFSFKALTNGDKIPNIFRLPKGKLGVIVILASIFSFVGLVSLIYAFKISDNIGYTSAVVGTVSLITFFFSWILFDKKPEGIGLFGALLILAGVYLISRCKN
jgi:drug/metabolite transporter (DMT)-like permease